MQNLPLDILNLIALSLDWESCLNYFRVTKRLYSLNNDKFWEKKKEEFNRSYNVYDKQIYNYLALINISTLYKGEIVGEKISNILINYLHQKYPNRFNIYHISSTSYRFDTREAYKLGARKYDLIFSYSNIIEYPTSGFFLEDNKVIFKFNGQGDIKFSKVFLYYIASFGLPLSSIKKLYNKNIIHQCLPIPFSHTIQSKIFSDKEFPMYRSEFVMRVTGSDRNEMKEYDEIIIEFEV